MACEACEHCQGPLSHHDAVIRGGFSYHHRCHKCYVCSETNLKGAEVFQGVIFCSSCSQRIFQGCSTARRSKAPKPKRTRSKSRHKHKRARRQDRSDSRSQHRLQREGGIIELSRRELFSSTDTSTPPPPDIKSSETVSEEVALQEAKEIYHNGTPEMKKDSVETGTTTLFTQLLLVETNPIIEWKKAERSPSPRPLDEKIFKPANPLKRHSFEEGKAIIKNKKIWSDLRVAELGESTEIANMALRRYSKDTELLTNKTASPGTAPDRGKSILSVLSDAASRECLQQWLDSTYQRSERRNVLPFVYRPVRGIVKIPFRYFKTRILDQSSLVSVIGNKKHCNYSVLNKIKTLFHEEINDHRNRGIKRLYPTINRRKVPYRLGWLHVESGFRNVNLNSRFTPNHSYQDRRRCKHLRKSHSYRCLRAHVMRLAGPTKSQLALIREKIKAIITLKFLRKINNSADNESVCTQSDSSKSSLADIAASIDSNTFTSPRKCSTL